MVEWLFERAIDGQNQNLKPKVRFSTFLRAMANCGRERAKTLRYAINKPHPVHIQPKMAQFRHFLR